MISSNLTFDASKPCGNCPYRKDAPLQHWHRAEYEKLLRNEQSQMGTIYGCHKQNGCVCVGWLMMQHRQGFPSINLRIKFIKDGVTREQLDALSSPAELYASTEEMIKANYPDIK